MPPYVRPPTPGKTGTSGQFDPYADVERAQEMARTGVEGYGETLRPHLLREIGTALGGLNSIGALRSGGTTVALGDISQNYSDTIGSYAKQAQGDAMASGFEATRLRQADRAQRFAEDEAKRRRRAGLFGAIGTALGAGIGFVLGGPPGAAAGAGVGGRAFSGEGANSNDSGAGYG